jgi:hypothetical protein
MIAFTKKVRVLQNWCGSGTTDIILVYRSRIVISIYYFTLKKSICYSIFAEKKSVVEWYALGRIIST